MFKIKALGRNYFIMFAVEFLIINLFVYLMKDRKLAMLIVSGFFCIEFFIYKLALINDSEYIEILKSRNLPQPEIMGELPLNPCNVILFLLPIALVNGNDYIMSFCFFTGILLPIAATISPVEGFNDYSIFKVRVFSFYSFHFAIAIVAVLLWVYGLYVPYLFGIVKACVFAVAGTVIVHFINLLLTKSGITGSANYCYTMNPFGSGILELFYKYIPVKCLYVLPIELLLYLVDFLIFSLIFLIF